MPKYLEGWQGQPFPDLKDDDNQPLEIDTLGDLFEFMLSDFIQTRSNSTQGGVLACVRAWNELKRNEKELFIKHAFQNWMNTADDDDIERVFVQWLFTKTMNELDRFLNP